MRPLIRRESEHLRRSRRRSKGHEVAGRMKAATQIGLVHQRAHATAGFNARDHRPQEIHAARVLRLGHGQRRCHVRGRGVAAHREVCIRKIQRIGHRTIDQRGVSSGRFFIVKHHGCQRVAALLARFGAKLLNQRLIGATNGNAKPIKHALPRGLHHVIRQRRRHHRPHIINDEFGDALRRLVARLRARFGLLYGVHSNSPWALGPSMTSSGRRRSRRWIR